MFSQRSAQRMKRATIHILLFAVIGVLLYERFAPESVSSGEEYPAKPIKLVVPFGPGGGSDTFGRIIKRGIDDAGLLPQPIVVINRPGGSATIGSRYVRDAKPDGYTLLLLHDAIITAKYSGKVSYGPEVFEPIAATAEIGMVFVVKETSRFETLTQLLKECRDKPDTVTNGVNLGAPTHFAALQLEQAFPGAKFRFTQSGDGSDRVQKLIGDHIEVSSFSVAEYVGFQSQGIRALAYLGNERHPALPDVPTASEEGIDVVDSNMHYWWFPKGTPQECSDYIADVLRKAMETEHVRERLAELHMEPVYFRGKEFQDYLDAQVEAAQKVGKQQAPHVPDMPLFIGIGLAVCAGQMVLERRRETSPSSVDSDADAVSPASKRAIGLLVATAVYVSSMQYGVTFALASTAFILIGGLLLCRDWKRFALPLWETSLIVAFGVQFLLTKVVVTDLP